MSTGSYIRLSNVSLTLPTFFQHQSVGDSWMKTLLGAAIDRPDRRLHPILHDINFEATDGDRVALIGRNGAGKTTLLHVLTGCYLPTAGQIDVFGSRQALLNVSLGFNPEATLRENIFLRGAAMGLPMNQIRALMPDILAFAQLEAYAGQRLVTLSAGQRMRLGFAISTSVQPDIMLLDEWIGTGDVQFLQRARERMQDRVSGAHIMVLASHSEDLVRRVCTRGVVLEGGRIVFDGAIAPAFSCYKDIVGSAKPAASPAAPEFRRRGLAHASRHGIAFASPVNGLFENVTDDAYAFAVEIENDTLANAFATLSASLAARGLRPSGFAATANVPNVFEFAGDDGASARITVMPYAAKDAARKAPHAVGRLHLALSLARNA